MHGKNTTFIGKRSRDTSTHKKETHEKEQDTMWPFDQNNQQMYQQYAQAYDNNNYHGIDNNQIWGHLYLLKPGAPIDMQQRIYQQHFDQMPYEQRVALAQQMPQGYYMDPNDTWSMAQSFHRLG